MVTSGMVRRVVSLEAPGKARVDTTVPPRHRPVAERDAPRALSGARDHLPQADRTPSLSKETPLAFQGSFLRGTPLLDVYAFCRLHVMGSVGSVLVLLQTELKVAVLVVSSPARWRGRRPLPHDGRRVPRPQAAADVVQVLLVPLLPTPPSKVAYPVEATSSEVMVHQPQVGPCSSTNAVRSPPPGSSRGSPYPRW